jgi:hypothetical protein
MSAARQRRRTLTIAAGTLLLGLIAGMLIGRGTASDVNDELNESRNRGRALAAALRALPLEYEQARSGSGETQAGIEDAVKRVARQAEEAVAKAPWLSASDRMRVSLGVGVVVDAAQRGVPTTEFEKAVEVAATTVEEVFGLKQ